MHLRPTVCGRALSRPVLTVVALLLVVRVVKDNLAAELWNETEELLRS